jgi:hypothetical protein
LRVRETVTHWAHNPKTVGSTPAPATKKEELKPIKQGIYKRGSFEIHSSKELKIMKTNTNIEYYYEEGNPSIRQVLFVL